MAAMARLMPELTALGADGEVDEEFRLVTVTHAVLGEEAFGIAPGHGEIWVTLRALTDDRLDALRTRACDLVTSVATAAGLAVAIPAVLAYNVFGRRIGRIEADLEGFARDLRELVIDTAPVHGSKHPQRTASP